MAFVVFTLMSKLGDSKVFGLNLKNRIYLASAFIILRALTGLWQFFKALTVLLGFWQALQELGLFFQDSTSSVRVWQALQELVKFFQDSASSSKNLSALPGFGKLFPDTYVCSSRVLTALYSSASSSMILPARFWQLFQDSVSSYS
jgi:hypothetical protein